MPAASAVYDVRYAATGAAAELFNRRDSEILISGPAGTGKSRACLEKVHLAARKYPGSRMLIARKTQRSLASSALQTYREKVARVDMGLGQVIFHGGGPQDPPQYRYLDHLGNTQSTITIGGLDNPDKIMSTEYDLIYIQEATECTPEDWEKLITRLRNWNMPYQQLLADCNPGAPTHWLKQRCDAGTTRMLYSQHEDNPTLFDPGTRKVTEQGADYLAKLDKLTGARKLRLRDGKWAASEGQVYEDWDESVHLVDPFTIPKAWPRYWGVDFGYTNPFVLQCWAEDPDGRLYLYREIYQTKRLVEDHAVRILDIVAPVVKDENDVPLRNDDGKPIRAWIEPKPRWVVCDHDAEGRETLKKHLGLPMRNAKKDVEIGIQAVQKRLRLAGDGKPRLFVHRHCVVRRDPDLEDAKKPTCTQEEVPGYVWDDSSKTDEEKEVPLKENDHGCDTKRYVVMQRDHGGNPGIRRM